MNDGHLQLLGARGRRRSEGNSEPIGDRSSNLSAGKSRSQRSGFSFQ